MQRRRADRFRLFVRRAEQARHHLSAVDLGRREEPTSLGQKLEDAGVQAIKVRSTITCRSAFGVCAHCYGRDLGRGHPVNHGEAVGVVAAQSIGQPGTQLTMRTFHIGGAASRAAAIDNVTVKTTGSIKFNNLKHVDHARGHLVAVSRSGEFRCWTTTAASASVTSCRMARPSLKDGADIKAGQQVANWDPHNHPIVSEVAGFVRFIDFVDGVTVIEKTDELTGLASRESPIRSVAARRARTCARSSASSTRTARI